MKPKSIIRLHGLRHTSTLALVTSLTAFAAGVASATQYTWLGSTDAVWSTASNWNANGVAPTNGTFVHRLSVSNTAANSAKPATYNFPGVTTTYTGDAASGGRGLVIGSAGANAAISGTMVISGGTFSTLGGLGADIIGNGTTNAGTLTIDGTANSGDAQYIGIDKGISLGLGFGSFATLNIKNGSATVFDLTTNNTTATINLETGGTLAMNKLAYAGGGNNIINFDGGTLKARTSSTTFIATPSNEKTTVNVKAGGAVINTDGSSITIARPILADLVSLGGGITKNGLGKLTLDGVSTTTGAATVNAGGLAVPAGAASWQPSSFSHSSSSMGFSIGVYNPSNLAPISTGNVTFTAPTTVDVTGSQFVVGQIPLLAYSGTLTGYANLTLNTATLPAGVVATLEDDGAGLICLDVTQGGFVWSGALATPGTGDWDTSSLNWNAFASAYSDPAPVTFPSIPGGGTVTLTTNVSPAAVEFINTTSDNYILAGVGKITGASSINKTGSGTVTLNNINDYTGNTTITSGTLRAGSSTAFTATGPLVMSGFSSFDLGGFDAGFTTINADSTYSGDLTLLGGIDSATNGTRLLLYSTFTTVDSETGLVTSGPYGTGAISVGQTATGKVQIYFQGANRIIANDIIVNTAVGTDTAATFRVEITFKRDGLSGVDSLMQVGVGTLGSPFTFYPVGACAIDGWNQTTINLSAYAGTNLTALALRFASGTPVDPYEIRIG